MKYHCVLLYFSSRQSCIQKVLGIYYLKCLPGSEAKRTLRGTMPNAWVTLMGERLYKHTFTTCPALTWPVCPSIYIPSTICPHWVSQPSQADLKQAETVHKGAWHMNPSKQTLACLQSSKLFKVVNGRNRETLKVHTQSWILILLFKANFVPFDCNL